MPKTRLLLGASLIALAIGFSSAKAGFDRGATINAGLGSGAYNNPYLQAPGQSQPPQTVTAQPQGGFLLFGQQPPASWGGFGLNPLFGGPAGVPGFFSGGFGFGQHTSAPGTSGGFNLGPLSASSPWGGFNLGPIGASSPWGSFGLPSHAGVPPFIGGFNLGPLSASSPWGGFNLGPIGAHSPWGGFNLGPIGASSPWGGFGLPSHAGVPPIIGFMPTFPGFNLGQAPQPNMMQMPYPPYGYAPYGYPQQTGVTPGQPAPAYGASMTAQTQGVSCSINEVPLLTSSATDCEKAGGTVVAANTQQ